MRRLWLSVLVVVLVCGFVPPTAHSQTGSGCAGVVRPLTPYATETLTVSSAAKTLTVSVMLPGGRRPTVAQLTTETDALRYYVDGTTPTNAVGHLIPVNSTILVCGPSIGRLKMIRVTNDVTVTVSYYE